MAVTFVKNIGSATPSMTTSQAITVPAAGVASGDLIVVRICNDGAIAVSSVTDTGGNTYTSRSAITNSNTVYSIYTAPVTVALTSGNSITVSWGSKTSGAIVADQWSGVGSFDTTAADATGTSSTPSSNAVTPSGVGLVIGGLGYASTSNLLSAEDGDSAGGDTWHTLTFVGSGSRGAAGSYKISTSAASQTYNPTLTGSSGWCADIVAFTESATGHTATGALTLPAVTVSGTGAEVFTSTGAVVLPSTTVSGTGHHPHQATGALSLPTVTVSGTGQEVFTSTGALTTEPIVIAGDGTHTNEKIGTGALTLPAVTVEGTGAEVFTATGAVVLSAVTVAGTGAEVFTSTGALTLAVPTLDGSGLLTITGTGALDLAALAIAGVGDSGTEPEPEPEPTGAQYYRVERLRKPKSVITGTGAIILPMAVVAGRGQSFDNDFRLLMDPELVLAGAI